MLGLVPATLQIEDAQIVVVVHQPTVGGHRRTTGGHGLVDAVVCDDSVGEHRLPNFGEESGGPRLGGGIVVGNTMPP